MFRFFSSFRRLVLAALLVLTALVMALPAGAACPPPSRIFAVQPGRPASYISKAGLLSELTGFEIVGVAPPVFGTLEEQGDSYVYHPQPGFWTAGLDSFLLRLKPTGRGLRGGRVETVLLLPAVLPDTFSQQDFEPSTEAWPVFGPAENVEVFDTGRVLSGARSARVYGFSGLSSGLVWGGKLSGGGQQGSGAIATLRPPGGGAGGNRAPDPTPATPGQMVILRLSGGDTLVEHRVWMRDDGEHLAFQLESTTGATAWLPVPREPHRVQILQWPRSGDFSRRSGAALFVDGARVAELVPSAGNDTDLLATELQVGGVETAGANPLYADVDDLLFQKFVMSPAWFCQRADGFEDGLPDPAWEVAGTLAVTSSASLEGLGGLEIPLGSGGSAGGAWLHANLPEEDRRLVVRFRFDPNSVSLPPGARVLLTSAVTSGGEDVFALLLEGAPSGYRLTLLDYGTSPRASAPIPISDLPQEIALDWQRSASSNVGLGSLRLWLGGEPKAELTGLANAGLEIAQIRLGAVAPLGWSTGAQGALYLDQLLVVRGPRP